MSRLMKEKNEDLITINENYKYQIRGSLRWLFDGVRIYLHLAS